MNNKILINKMRDNAELAQAAYGYFHFMGKEFKAENIKNTNRKNNPTITFHDILDLTYKGYEVKDTGLIFDDKLKGDFSPLQAKRFFSRYDLLIHQPNTDSGFSATFFYNKETKEFTLAIRGTEFKINQAWQDIITTDGSLLLSSTPLEQYNDMLRFYNQCKTKYPKIKAPNSLTLTGHSLGGC